VLRARSADASGPERKGAVVTQALRLRTRGHHERVERAVDLPKWCASLPAYRCLLRRMLGLYEPLEERLSRFDWAPAGIDFEARRKVERLRADLRALGADQAELDPAPRGSDLPPLTSLAQAFGCLYVLEGATLGGRVIARGIQGTLGLTDDTGAAFFSGYGERTSAMWRAFGDAADAHCGDDEGRIAGAVAAAGATFDLFEAWLRLDEAPVEPS
jgi:heme oxygenase (biliverdin-IX-beta and delta-forming)